MENNTLIFNYMKAKVKMNPKDVATYAFILAFALVMFYVAISAHK